MTDPKELPRAISADTVKVIAEAIGIPNTNEDACKYLADDITYRLQRIIQESEKLTAHSKRRKLNCKDVDYTLKMMDYEPIYGFSSSEGLPFRGVSGGGREIYFTEEKEIDLDELTSKPLPKVPLNTSLKAHWLAIEGVQPAIPENPPSLSKDRQKLEAVNPVTKVSSTDRKTKTTMIKPDIKVKPQDEHDLSVEQQLYYKEITEACISHSEEQRTAALTSLAKDPGLHKMVPRLVCFISEGVKLNTIQTNLAILIYLMRMSKSLFDNHTLYLEKYLHQLLPAILTCIVSKQLCVKPDTDNHWALRDFAAKLIASICKKFNTMTNNLQSRVVKLISDPLRLTSTPLTTLYGCVFTLKELDQGAVQQFVLPIVGQTADKIRPYLDGAVVSDSEKKAAQHIRNVIVKSIAPVLKITRRGPDNLEQYRIDYRALGQAIYEEVIKLRSQANASQSLLNKSLVASQVSSRAQTPVSIINQSTLSRSYSIPGGGRPAQPQLNIRAPGSSPLIRTPSTTAGKYIIMSQSQTQSTAPGRPGTPTGQTLVRVLSRPSSPQTVTIPALKPDPVDIS